MGFDLTGYEKDTINMSTLGIYTFLGILSLIVVIAALSFYFFIEKERIYTENVLEGGVEDTYLYKQNQFQELNSFGKIVNDKGESINRIPINKAIENTNIYYNE